MVLVAEHTAAVAILKLLAESMHDEPAVWLKIDAPHTGCNQFSIRSFAERHVGQANQKQDAGCASRLLAHVAGTTDGDGSRGDLPPAGDACKQQGVFLTLTSATFLTLYPGAETDGVPSWRRLRLAAAFRDMKRARGQELT